MAMDTGGIQAAAQTVRLASAPSHAKELYETMLHRHQSSKTWASVAPSRSLVFIPEKTFASVTLLGKADTLAIEILNVEG